MKYFVILSYCGNIQYNWLYDIEDYSFATNQYSKLIECFKEVAEAHVYMFKLSPQADRTFLTDLIKDLYNLL